MGWNTLTIETFEKKTLHDGESLRGIDIFDGYDEGGIYCPDSEGGAPPLDPESTIGYMVKNAYGKALDLLMIPEESFGLAVVNGHMLEPSEFVAIRSKYLNVQTQTN